MGEEPGAVVAGFDVHRRQITVDALDTATGEVSRGQLESTPAAVEEWVAGFAGRVIHVAVEACTGWLFVSRALERRARSCIWPSRWRRARCGAANVAPRPTAPTPAGCASCCARAGCRSRGYLRSMSASGARARGCGTRWRRANELDQRIRATLYHHGVAGAPDELRTLAGRRFLAALELPVDAQERIKIALEIIDLLDAQLAELERDLRALARRQAGCQALMTQYGMGEISSGDELCELGDVRRLHASRQAVRMAGIEMLASNCTSCSGDFGLRDVAGVRDPFAAFLLDGGVERDAQAVGAVAVRGELVV